VFVSIRKRYCRTKWAKNLAPNSCSYVHQNLILMDLQIYISQGSVATQLRCDGIFSKHFITNFPQNRPMPVKNFEKWSKFGEDMDKNLQPTFLATVYIT